MVAGGSRCALAFLCLAWLARADCGKRGSTEGCHGHGICLPSDSPHFQDHFFDECKCDTCYSGFDCSHNRCAFAFVPLFIPLAVLAVVVCCGCICCPLCCPACCGGGILWLLRGRRVRTTEPRAPLLVEPQWQAAAAPQRHPQHLGSPVAVMPAPTARAAPGAVPVVTAVPAVPVALPAAPPEPPRVAPAALEAPAAHPPKFTVKVPEGCEVGSQILFRGPDGQEAMVTVPDGAGPGSVLEVQLPQ
mmetsp:Transcript_34172/g.79430  ORF Transcript_34172/g.79430 Transcript_34172/m.79430 type:complete len:246 (-) Transcript_34172:61-798(-)